MKTRQSHTSSAKTLTAVSLAVLSVLLLWSAAIHLQFLRAVEDPIFSPDSLGYSWPGIRHVLGQPLQIEGGRTPIYPLFVYAGLKLARSFDGVLLLQHSLALITGLISGWLYYKHVKSSMIGAAIVFFCVSALPIPAIYAHAILTETLYTALLMTALVFLFNAQQDGKPLSWFFLGLCVCLTILTRPVGYALLATVLVFSIPPFSNTQAKLGGIYAILGAGCIVALLYVGGFSRTGFFGVNRFNGYGLFGSSARYLDPAHISDPKARAILQPLYDREREKFSEFNWVCHTPEGPVQSLLRAYPPEEVDPLIQNLAYQAIRDRPFAFLGGQLRLLAGYFADYSAIPEIYLNRQYTFFVYRGLMLYGELIAKLPGAAALLHHSPNEAVRYFSRVRALAVKPDTDAQTELAQLDRDDIYHYDRVLRLWTPIRWAFSGLRLLPLAAFAGSLVLWRNRSLRRIIAACWLVIFLHAALSTFFGVEPRYAFPITPVYWILAVGGIEWFLIDNLSRFSLINRQRRHP